MRIGILSLIPWGFVKQRPHAFAQELAKLGHEVFFFEPLAFNSPVVEFFKTITTPFRVQKIEENIYLVTSLLLQGRENVRHFLWFNRFAEALIKFIVKRNKLDFIIAIEHEYARLLQSLRIPYAYDHIDDTQYIPGMITERVVENIRILKKGSAFNIYIQERSASEDEKGIFLPNGCYPEEFFPLKVRKKFFDAVVIALFSDWVDFDSILNSKKNILLIGPMEKKAYLEQYMALKKNNIFWIPRLEKAVANLWLNRAMVGLVPFKEDHPVTEYAMPVKILEYFLCNIPVVTYKNRGIEEMYGDMVTYYSSSGKGLSLDDAIVRAKEKKLDYRQFAEKYNWVGIIKRLEEEIKKFKKL